MSSDEDAKWYEPGEQNVKIHGFAYRVLFRLTERGGKRNRIVKRTWYLQPVGGEQVFQWSARPNKHGEIYDKPRADAHLEPVGILSEMKWLQRSLV